MITYFQSNLCFKWLKNTSSKKAVEFDGLEESLSLVIFSDFPKSAISASIC